ncbi:MAG: FeoA family protein [Flavobacteriales bacterium]
MDPLVANTISLDQLPEAGRATVTGVEVPADPAARTLALRLLELGFVPGEQVHMVRVVHPSGEPLAVRLDHTTFALRRSEAVLIQVIPVA